MEVNHHRCLNSKISKAPSCGVEKKLESEEVLVNSCPPTPPSPLANLRFKVLYVLASCCYTNKVPKINLMAPHGQHRHLSA